MDGDVLTRIQKARTTMSKGQRRIADYICANLDKAAFLTAEAMGANANTSESTVVRFSGVLGYKGYPQMQKALQELIKSRLTNVQRMGLTSQLTISQVMSTVMRADMDNIRSTLLHEQEDSFEKAVQAIAKARTVYVLGLRSSLPLAQFLSYYLSYILHDVRLLHPAMLSATEMLSQGTEQDVCVGISFPRYSQQTLDALSYARTRKMLVIGLTGNVDSPLYKLSDIALIARSDMVSFADSLVAPLSLVNALIVALGLIHQDEAVKRFDTLEDIWQMDHTYSVTARTRNE